MGDLCFLARGVAQGPTEVEKAHGARGQPRGPEGSLVESWHLILVQREYPTILGPWKGRRG